MAQDPKLKLLPVSIRSTQHDTIINKDMIDNIVKDSISALEDGRLQDARNMIKDLASEVVITTTSIPLITYPDDIKAIVPLISKHKFKEAKVALHNVLSSLLVVKEIIPLPILRTTYILENAEKLVEKTNRTKKDNEKLELLLKESINQLEIAQKLGYGKKDNFKLIYEQIDIIKNKSKDNKNGKGWFDILKEKISQLNK